MANKIVTLKDSTGTDNCYPITSVDAVFVDSNTTLSGVLNDKADIDMANIDTGSITADKIDFTTLGFGNYSLTEVDTGFTWVDGKHIYKKTVDCGALPNATDKTVSIGASNVHRYIGMDGVAWTSNGNTSVPLPMAATASAVYQVSLWIDSGNVVITAGDNKSQYTQCYVTVYYTKN